MGSGTESGRLSVKKVVIPSEARELGVCLRRPHRSREQEPRSLASLRVTRICDMKARLRPCLFFAHAISIVPKSVSRPKISTLCSIARVYGQYNSHERTVFGGCCQWVLDAVRQTVEVAIQPLGFESLARPWSLDSLLGVSRLGIDRHRPVP